MSKKADDTTARFVSARLSVLPPNILLGTLTHNAEDTDGSFEEIRFADQSRTMSLRQIMTAADLTVYS